MLLTSPMKHPVVLAAILCSFLITEGRTREDVLTESTKVGEKGLREAIASQKRIDAVADETRDMLDEYREVLRQTETLQAYNDQLERMIAEQNQQLASLRRQRDDARSIQQHLFPIVKRMVKVLGELIDLDLPFLLRERRLRLEELKHLLDDPSVSLPDKYRRVMEAFQVEMEYGRSIEAYRDEIVQEERQRTVDLLRIGRIALLYITLDGKRAGYWNTRSRRWQSLPPSARAAIDRGLRIANKQAPPDLLSVPVYAPELTQ